METEKLICDFTSIPVFSNVFDPTRNIAHLFEVVNKIERMGYWTRLQSLNNGREFKFYIGKTGSKTDFQRRGKNRIDTILYAVCEFIKFYNEKK